jgi:hypothetical protein
MKKDNLEDASFKLYSVIVKRSIVQRINHAVDNGDLTSLFPEYKEAAEQNSRRALGLQGIISLILSVMMTLSVTLVYLPNILKSFNPIVAYLIILCLALPVYGFSLYLSFSSKKTEKKMPTMHKIAASLSFLSLGLLTCGLIFSLITN